MHIETPFLMEVGFVYEICNRLELALGFTHGY